MVARPKSQAAIRRAQAQAQSDHEPRPAPSFTVAGLIDLFSNMDYDTAEKIIEGRERRPYIKRSAALWAVSDRLEPVARRRWLDLSVDAYNAASLNLQRLGVKVPMEYMVLGAVAREAMCAIIGREVATQEIMDILAGPVAPFLALT